MITSTSGFISAVSRDGIPLSHSVCNLEEFNKNRQPLFVSADFKSPNLFYIYSQTQMRVLDMHRIEVPTTLPGLLSLDFPFGSANPCTLR